MTEKSSVFPIESLYAAHGDKTILRTYIFKSREGFAYVEAGRNPIFTRCLENALRYMLDSLAAYNNRRHCGRVILYGDQALHIPVGEFDREGIGSKLMKLIAEEEKK